MKINLQIALLALFSLLLSANAQAEEGQKRLSIGLGTYGFAIDFIDEVYLDLESSGFALNAAFAANDNIAVKGAIFSLERDDNQEIENSGYDVSLVFGTGLATEGFKIYGGLGVFKDTWSRPGYESLKFSSTQLVGGLGYNWDALSFDLSFGIRDADEYFAETVDHVAVSAGMTVSARF